MVQRSHDALTLTGRILMCLLFVLGGWGKLLTPAATETMLASHALPLVGAGWLLAVVVELGGGLALLAGLFTRPVAGILAIWCIATALIAHSHLGDRGQEIHFFKNMAMTGGFLYIVAFGAGDWSLDGWLSRRRGAIGAG